MWAQRCSPWATAPGSPCRRNTVWNHRAAVLRWRRYFPFLLIIACFKSAGSYSGNARSPVPAWSAAQRPHSRSTSKTSLAQKAQSQGRSILRQPRNCCKIKGRFRAESRIFCVCFISRRKNWIRSSVRQLSAWIRFFSTAGKDSTLVRQISCFWTVKTASCSFGWTRGRGRKCRKSA